MTLLQEKIKSSVLNYRWEAFSRSNRLPEIYLENVGITRKDFTPVFTEEICLPPYRGDENLDDYSVLFSILDYLKPKLVLELGTGYGNTVANICTDSDATVITVNALPEQINGRVTTYTLTKEQIGKVYRTQGFSQNIFQVYEDTKKLELSKLISEKSVNFAIIDACHDSDYVLNDFLKILPFMAPGSTVLLHDTHPSMKNHYIDSYIACMYLRKLGHNISHIKNTSWAIWFHINGSSHESLAKRTISSIAKIMDRLVFGSQQDDLLRIRRFAKTIANK